MSYAIDEHDHQRQQLLADVLNPFTERHVARLAPAGRARWLDLGCGLGHTTLMLTRHMAAGSECVGVDNDARLLDAARAEDWGTTRVSFQQGDVSQLPFDDGSFDFIFSRYLLMHLPDPLAAIREMRRVAGPGGLVFAQEPDFAYHCCYPASPAYDHMAELLGSVIPDARIGCKLVHFFREAGATSVQAAADIGIECDGTDFKRIYRMTIEAMRAALLGQEGMSESRYQEFLQDLIRIEQDPTHVVIANPLVAVWARV